MQVCVPTRATGRRDPQGRIELCPVDPATPGGQLSFGSLDLWDVVVVGASKTARAVRRLEDTQWYLLVDH